MADKSVDPFDLRNRVVLVTGGTRGLGRAISAHLAAQGARVIAGYFQNEVAARNFREEAASHSWECSTIRANLMTSQGIVALTDHVKQQYGRLDALVYNAATGVHRVLAELNQRQLALVWQVNAGAFLELCLKLRPLMSTGARIVAISSEGSRRAVPSYGAVGSSKAALEALCRQLAAEWAADGVVANCLAPGLLETETLDVLPEAEERVRREAGSSPIGRLVRLSEVAAVVHFLCSQAAEAIIGQTLVVDGGKSISSL